MRTVRTPFKSLPSERCHNSSRLAASKAPGGAAARGARAGVGAELAPALRRRELQGGAAPANRALPSCGHRSANAETAAPKQLEPQWLRKG